jgi:hypothetical protein
VILRSKRDGEFSRQTLQVLNKCLINYCLSRDNKKKNIDNFVFVSLTKTKHFRCSLRSCCLEALAKSKNEAN